MCALVISSVVLFSTHLNTMVNLSVICRQVLYLFPGIREYECVHNTLPFVPSDASGEAPESL